MSDLPSRPSLYEERYAARYAATYIDPWPNKHRINLDLLETLLPDDRDDAVWVDTCCGQAWHFSKIGRSVRKIGVDRSAAQLARAAASNADAFFIHSDVRALPLRERSASLVTNFWGSYCYLSDDREIGTFFDACCRAVAPGGSIYFEILAFEDVALFNDAAFAREHGFRVETDPDGARWTYTDSGGVHRMLSPPITLFESIAELHFDEVRQFHDGAFINHLTCRRRRQDVSPA